MSDDVKELIRANFEDFLVLAFHHTHPDEELYLDDYLQYICYRYQILKKGARVVFNQPPRTLKSWTTKFYVAWYMGRRPSARVMIIANTQRLAEDIVYEIREILRARWYRRTFPKMRIARDRAAVNQLKTTKGGSLFAGSVETSLAGFGADLLIVDDPNKILELRPDQLETVNRKFDSEIYSRLNNRKKGIVIVIQHRLNENDLSGHLIRDGYKRIALPLVAPRTKAYRIAKDRLWHRKKGDVLSPKSYSAKELEKAKRSQNYYWFYQQGMGQQLTPFRAKNFTFIESPTTSTPSVISIDAAQRDGALNSFSVIQVWKITEASFHLADQFREQCRFPALESKATFHIKRDRPAIVLVENAANGTALFARLKARFKKIDIRAVEPRGSKADRLNRHRSAIQKGKISLAAGKDWNAAYIQEFIDFPAGNTDQIDATTQFLDFMATKPVLKTPEPRAIAQGVTASGIKIDTQGRAISNSPHAALALGSHLRRK